MSGQPTQTDSPSEVLELPTNGSVHQKIFIAILSVAALSPLGTNLLVSPSGPTLLSIPFFASLLMLACLSGAWLGLGNSRVRWGVALVMPIVLTISISIAIRSSNESGVFFMMVTCPLVFVAILTWLLRLFAGDFKQCRPDHNINDALQFGILDLMRWTAVIAISIVIGKWFFGLNMGRSPVEFRFVSITTITLGLATFLNIWAMHGQFLTPGKLLTIAVVTFIAALVSMFSFEDEPLFFPGIVVVSQVAVISLMYCLRRQGYRFVKRAN